VAVDRSLERIVPSNRLSVDIDLDRRRADLRHCPEMRGHAAGFAADEADKVGTVDHAIGALARIGADDADRERMIARDRVLAVERGRDWNLQRLCERYELGRGARAAYATARDDHRPLRVLQQLERGVDAGAVGRWPERRHARKALLGERLHLGLIEV